MTKTTAALIVIAFASSLIVTSGGGVVGSAIAAAKKENQKSDDGMNKILSASQDQDKSDPTKSSTTSGDLSGDVGNTNNLSTKELKKLSKCQSGAASDGDLTLGEVKDCYSQLSDQGQGQEQEQGKEDQSSSAQEGLLVLGQG